MTDTVKSESVLEPVNRVRRLVDFSDDIDSTGYSDIEQLNEWKKNGSIIESRIKGVEIRNIDDKPHVFVISMLQGYEVMIRDEDYFLPNSMKDFFYALPEKEKIQSMVRRLNVRINAKVVFMIKKLQPTDNSVVIHASRTAAMRKRRLMHLIQKNGISEYKAERGSIVECDVLSVGERGCLVSCCGKEILIDSDKLSGRFFVDDCRKFYHSGDVITALVSKIYLNDERTEVTTLKVSPKAYDNYLMRNNLSKITVGGIYSGLVRSYVSSSKPKYVIVLDVGVIAQIEARHINNTKFLQLGERVVVKVLYKNEGYVSGWAIKSDETIRY